MKAGFGVKILLLSRDLLVGSQISGAVRSCNADLEVVSDLSQLLAAPQKAPVQLVFIDLSTAGLDIDLVVKQIHAIEPPPRIVAFGPHVHRVKLSAARAAGCDCVMSRGEFYTQIDAVLKECHPGGAD
jgi:DNA-binding NarL/FixJ family response regulator